MYPWSNETRLDTLEVSGKDGVLSFHSETADADVHFDDSGILKVVCKSRGDETEIVDPHHIVVGEGIVQRDVYHYLKPGGPAKHLRLGLTRHCGLGTWSSLPHDFELNTEPGFEEVFFYLLSGTTRTAIQRGRGVWYDNSSVDDAWLVKDRTFSTIPMGYHPVAAEPGVQVMYIWAYLAKTERWEKV